MREAYWAGAIWSRNALTSPAPSAQQELSEFLYGLLPKLGGMRDAAESNATLVDRYSALYDSIEREADRLASHPPVQGKS